MTWRRRVDRRVKPGDDGTELGEAKMAFFRSLSGGNPDIAASAGLYYHSGLGIRSVDLTGHTGSGDTRWI
jgi:hypothetical protein